MNINKLFLESYVPVTALVIDQGCLFKKQQETTLHDFCDWCLQNLNLPNIPQIHVVDNRDSGITTGAYNPSNHEIMVYGRNRALIDIMRTLAHELTHYRQRLQDRIKSSERDWELEGEADAEAGKMVYTFTHSKPERMLVYEM